MHRYVTRLSIVLAFALVATFAFTANAAVLVYVTNMDGPSESPPVPSPGTGVATVTFDTDMHTMRVEASFMNLVGTTTVAHIHAPTAVAFTGTVGVATTTPSFVGWPVGVMAGAYDMTYDLTQASSYNAAFITANGGSPASAETALLQYVAEGRAYFNVHTSFRTGGEIRGFLVPFTVPTRETTWGGVKALYR
jgi:hypothetical protein